VRGNSAPSAYPPHQLVISQCTSLNMRNVRGYPAFSISGIRPDLTCRISGRILKIAGYRYGLLEDIRVIIIIDKFSTWIISKY
jgi:hypothetical protein